jgi:hypothetical protein
MPDECQEDPHDQHICIAHGNAWWPTGQECCNEARAETMRRQDRETAENIQRLIKAMRGEI